LSAWADAHETGNRRDARRNSFATEAYHQQNGQPDAQHQLAAEWRLLLKVKVTAMQSSRPPDSFTRLHIQNHILAIIESDADPDQQIY